MKDHLHLNTYNALNAMITVVSVEHYTLQRLILDIPFH